MSHNTLNDGQRNSAKSCIVTEAMTQGMKIFYALFSLPAGDLFIRDNSQRMQIPEDSAVYHSFVIQIHFRRFRQHILVIPGFIPLPAEEISQFPLDRNMDQSFIVLDIFNLKVYITCDFH